MIKKRNLKTDRMPYISGGFSASELAMFRLNDFTPARSTLGEWELDDLIDWENKKETLDWLDSL